jgi:tetratricopeptide (TPR) repeat protein
VKSTLHCSVQQASAISRSSIGRTLGVAGWVLAAAALGEIIAAGVALTDRAQHVPPLTIQVPPLNIADSGPPPLPSHADSTPSFGDPFASQVAATPTPAQAPAIQPAATPALPVPAATPPPAIALLPKPTPVEETQVAAPQSRLDSLLAEAAALKLRGDMSTAITRLREALAISPNNPQVIANLAGTYEKMDLQDKALEQWRAIYDMGESAGIYYEAADAKLKAAEFAEGTPEPTPGSDNEVDSNGFQQGSVLALINLSTDEKPETSEGYKRFTLKIPVKRRPDTKIDVPGVVIQVFFYDQLGDDSIVRTNADVESHWNKLPADWVQDDVEILDVDYTQAAPEPGKIEEARHYYGYVVCVYYNKQLQDEAADPISLIKTYPPPLTLPDK